MKEYIFEAPDDWNLNECSIEVNNGKIAIRRPEDHWIHETCKTKITPMNEHPYYGTLHSRVGKCTADLREHFSLGYIVDSVGGIQALEITTEELMKY